MHIKNYYSIQNIHRSTTKLFHTIDFRKRNAFQPSKENEEGQEIYSVCSSDYVFERDINVNYNTIIWGHW